MRPEIRLISPTESLRDSFLRGARELQQEGLSWWQGVYETAARDFPAFVAQKLADARPSDPDVVPKTHLWAVWEAEFVGRISLFHRLDPALRREGGHIGYDTVPSLRGRGVAAEMLRLILPVARGLGLTEVLLTCDDTNAASIRVIERNGGILREIKALDPSRPLKRHFTITL